MSARGSIPASSMWGRTISAMELRLPAAADPGRSHPSTACGPGPHAVLGRTRYSGGTYLDMPEKMTATDSPGAGAPSGVSRPARPAVPVGRDGHAGGDPEPVGLDDRRLRRDDRPAAGAAHDVEHAEPVVRLVVEDAVGGRVRVGPRASSARTSRPPASATAARAGDSARASGAQPSLCTASSRTPCAEAPAGARRERPAADLHEHPIEWRRRRRPAPSRSCARRRGTARSPALHAERDRSGGDRLAEPQHGRIAGRVASNGARTGGSSRPDDSSRPSTVADAQVGTNTSIGQYARRASVAAAMAALPHEAMASGRRCPVARRSDSAATRCSRIVTRCRPLWLPPTLPVSSLTQTSAPTVGRRATTSGRTASRSKPVGELLRSARRTPPSVMPWARANAHHARRGP